MAQFESSFQEGQPIADPVGGTFSGTEDADMQKALPTTNHGAGLTWRVDFDVTFERTAWLAFNIFGVLPQNAEVLDAKLELNVASAVSNAAGDVAIFRCLKGPVESQITWNYFKGTPISPINWNVAGGKSSSDVEDDNDDPTKADRRSKSGRGIWQWTYDGSTGWYTVIPQSDSDFIALVQDWVDGDIGAHRGLLFDARNGLGVVVLPSADVTINSSEAAIGTVRPRLWVSWRIPSVFGVTKVNELNRFNVVPGA
jgi:hypothetical protein